MDSKIQVQSLLFFASETVCKDQVSKLAALFLKDSGSPLCKKSNKEEKESKKEEKEVALKVIRRNLDEFLIGPAFCHLRHRIFQIFMKNHFASLMAEEGPEFLDSILDDTFITLNLKDFGLLVEDLCPKINSQVKLITILTHRCPRLKEIYLSFVPRVTGSSPCTQICNYLVFSSIKSLNYRILVTSNLQSTKPLRIQLVILTLLMTFVF